MDPAATGRGVTTATVIVAACVARSMTLMLRRLSGWLRGFKKRW
jgi:hypothetical protein